MYKGKVIGPGMYLARLPRREGGPWAEPSYPTPVKDDGSCSLATTGGLPFPHLSLRAFELGRCAKVFVEKVGSWAGFGRSQRGSISQALLREAPQSLGEIKCTLVPAHSTPFALFITSQSQFSTSTHHPTPFCVTAK